MVETFATGHLDSMGLGYSQLKEINPKIILVSITGFGQTGPYKDYKVSDLVGLAVSGVLYTMGFPEDPPTSLGASQAYHMVSSNAAIGALMVRAPFLASSLSTLKAALNPLQEPNPTTWPRSEKTILALVLGATGVGASGSPYETNVQSVSWKGVWP